MSYLLSVWDIFWETNFFGQLDIVIIIIIIITSLKKKCFSSRTKLSKISNKYEPGFIIKSFKNKIGLFIAEKKYNSGRCLKIGKGICTSCSRNPHHHIDEFSRYGLHTLSKKFVVNNICKHFR